jgi:hypothetical protein
LPAITLGLQAFAFFVAQRFFAEAAIFRRVAALIFRRFLPVAVILPPADFPANILRAPRTLLNSRSTVLNCFTSFASDWRNALTGSIFRFPRAE